MTVQVGGEDALGINGTPFAVAMSSDGKHAYITDSANDRVSVLDVATRAVVGSVAVGGAPSGIAVAGDGRAYVVNSADGTVTVFDTATNRIVRPYVYVGSDPTGIAVNAAGTRVVVANGYEDSVSVIDTGTWNVTRVVVGHGPYGVAISGNHALITNEFDDTVTVLDLSTNTVAGTIAVGDAPTGIAAAGNHAVVTNMGTTTTPGDGTVTIIDLDTFTVVGSPISVGDSPMSVVIDATGTYAYIADQERSVVSVLDIAAAAMTDQIYAVAAGPTGLTLDNDGELFVAGYMSGTVDPLDVGVPTTAAGTDVSLAAAVTANPATAAPAPPTAPIQEWSTSTKGFDIYNDSLNPLVLTYEGVNRPNGGGPAEGTVLAPGAHLHLEIPAGFRQKVVTVVLTQSTGESWKMRLWTNSVFGVNHGDVALRHYDADGNLVDSRLGGGSYLAEFFLPWYLYDRYQVDPIRISDSSSTTRTLTVDDPDAANLLTACKDGSSAKCTFQPDGGPTVTWTEWQQAMTKQGRVGYEHNDRSYDLTATFEIGYTAVAGVVTDVGVKSGLALEKPIFETLTDASGKVIPNVRTFLPPTLRYSLQPDSSIRLQVRAPLLRYTGDITIKVGNSVATITGVVYDVPDTQRDVEISGAVKPGP
ncbi:YncE family protein [Mycobacterium hodleri]|uniref:YncE family protein n=1 Tax=Mycolicibacterium hodleri TaxID=49897 RepID=A0A544W6E0_9MYCO|nr:YncE family protein [Mycolicibacterium hodleri]